MDTYKNKWALVTGASAGIGKCYAQELARRGANLVLVARNEAALQELAAALRAQHGVETRVVACDLSVLDTSQNLFREVEAAGVPVDILINNAGFGIYGRLEETELRRSQELLLVNVVALASLTQLFLQPMVKRNGGIIINLASTAAFQPVPYMANYAASKAFVRSFTEAIAAEHRTANIRFLTVSPGATDTQFFDVVGRSEAAVGAKASPEAVVAATFHALERGKTSVITGGFVNGVLAQLSRLLPYRTTARITSNVMRPRG